jgi:hypothetical protein
MQKSMDETAMTSNGFEQFLDELANSARKSQPRRRLIRIAEWPPYERDSARPSGSIR